MIYKNTTHEKNCSFSSSVFNGNSMRKACIFMKSCVKNGWLRIVDKFVRKSGSSFCKLCIQRSLKSDKDGTSSKQK